MARVTDVFVSGSVEHLVLYRRMGKNCSRIKRSHINQTVATRARGVNFGIAARAGKCLRYGLKAVIPLTTDRRMQSRFSGAIAKWLGQSAIDDLPACDVVPYLSNFQFTTGYTFKERFKVPVSVSQPQEGLITVSIDAFVPALRIAAPAGTVLVKLAVSVAGCLLKSGSITGSETLTLDIPFNDIEVPAQVLDFHIPTPPGSLTVTATRLMYIGQGHYGLSETGLPAFMPAGVIDARYSGVETLI
jgi:hypothetical protein